MGNVVIKWTMKLLFLPEERRAILKHAGLLNEEPMIEDRNDFPKEETQNPDEIIVRDIDTLHFEVMEEGKRIWIGITRKNGQIDHLNICVKGKKLSTLWSPNTGNMNEPYGGTAE